MEGIMLIILFICCFLTTVITHYMLSKNKYCNSNYNLANEYSKLEIDEPEYKVQAIIDTEELLNRLWKRAEEGYYDDKPPYQFSEDELNLMYYLGWIDEASYHLEKQKLEQRIDEYNCCKRHYLFVL